MQKKIQPKTWYSSIKEFFSSKVSLCFFLSVSTSLSFFFLYYHVLIYFQGGRNVFGKLKEKYSQALRHLFPDVSGIAPGKLTLFDSSLLSTLHSSRYLFSFIAFHKPENRRKFFIDYANANGFDALSPSGWYLQSKDKILATKVISIVLFFCFFSFILSSVVTIYRRE